MNVTSSKSRPVGHEPSAPPDERALFSRLAASMARHRRAVIITWLLVAFAAAPLALTLSSALSGAGWEAQGSIAQVVRDELRKDFASLGAENPIVVYHQATPITADPSGLRSLVAQLQHAPHAHAVVEPALRFLREAGLISRDGRTALDPRRPGSSTTDAQRPDRGRRARPYVGGLQLASGAQAKVTGEWPVWSDFNKVNAEALHKAELRQRPAHARSCCSSRSGR